MQAYGRRKIHCNHPDYHIHGKSKRQGYVNWWEVDFDCVIKARARRQGKKEIREEYKNAELRKREPTGERGRDYEGWYYGKREQFETRHADLLELADRIEDIVNDDDARIKGGTE